MGGCVTVSVSESSLLISDVQYSTMTTKKRNTILHRAHVSFPSHSVWYRMSFICIHRCPWAVRRCLRKHISPSCVGQNGQLLLPQSLGSQIQSRTTPSLTVLRKGRWCDCRGKHLTASEYSEIVVNDLRCACEVACSPLRFVRTTVGTKNRLTKTVIATVRIPFCMVIHSRRRMPYTPSNLILSKFVGQTAVATLWENL